MSNAAAALTDAIPPAGTPATGEPPAGTPPAGQWYESHPDESIRNWAANKGWADPNAALESGYNLEKLVGFEKAGRTLVVPKEDATPEEKRAFYTKLGVPEAADKYELPVPEGQSDAFSKTAAEWMLKHNVSKEAAQGLTKEWNEFQAAQETAHRAELDRQSDLEMQDLKTEWGAAHTEKTELAKRAAAQFIPAANAQERAQVLSKIEDAIGTGAMMKLFASIGEGLGEHKTNKGDELGSGHTLTPAQAKARIEALKSDKAWASAYLTGDAAKQAEMAQLTKLAFPEQPQ